MTMATDSPRYPRFFTVNDRPIKLVQTADGGVDALAFDWKTGGFVPAREYFSAISEHGTKDVDQLTELEFETRVMLLRAPITDKLLIAPLVWEATGDGEFPYRAKIGDQTLTIRVNDFPAEPMYTLLIGEEAVQDLDDWPSAWTRPGRVQQ
jgi:hypothetical protein